MTESKSKVEEVARYMRRRKFERTNRLNSYDPNVPLTDNELDDARAAIEALRVPTAAMVDAGAKHENWHSYHDTRNIYGAMLDAALNESERGQGNG